eukprot:6364412-Amphidinium_carterae.1
MASEVWAAMQERSAGYLGRLRAFVRQNDRKAMIPSSALEIHIPDSNCCFFVIGGKGVSGSGWQFGCLGSSNPSGTPGAVEELLKMNADPLCIANAGCAQRNTEPFVQPPRTLHPPQQTILAGIHETCTGC